MQKYYYEIVACIKNGDIFTEEIASTRKEAIKLGKMCWERMSEYDKKRQVIQVLRFDVDPSLEENIEAPCDLIKEWKWKKGK